MKINHCYIIIAIFVSVLVGCKSADKGIQNETKSLTMSVHIQELENGSLERIDSFPSKYITPRGVDVWLPKDYVSTKSYSVLYMQDGQRMFTGEADKKGREMMIDETASRLMAEDSIRDLIVVGIHSIGKLRQRNYFPQKPYNSRPEELTDSLTRIGKAMRRYVTRN